MGMTKAERLTKALELLEEKYDFKKGDIVEWKKGMQNKRSEGPFIVMEVLASPVCDGTKDAGSPYFREPLDIVLGSIDSDGYFLTYYFDSRRFAPKKG